VESGCNVQYTVKRVANKRRVTIKITIDGSVIVSANYSVPVKKLDSFVCMHSGWIQEKINYVTSLPEPLPPHTYQEGDRFYLFDQIVTLAVDTGTTAKTVLIGNVLQVTVKKTSRESVRKAVTAFYREQGLVLYRSLVEQWLQKLSIPTSRIPKSISMSNFSSRMGSCSQQGDLKFALRSLMLPLGLIDYLALHETAHLIHFNHGSAFKAVLDEQMPDWKRRKQEMLNLYRRCASI
jgi:predicted metal-dependent hydrolase